MGDNKAVPIAGGILLFLLLPLLIVIVMLLSSMSALGEEQCVPTPASESLLAYPTEGEHRVTHGFSDADPAHAGIDYEVAPGSDVVAAADGKVISASGDIVKIEHGEGVQTWYQYVQSISVNRGQEVKRGDVIGKGGAGGHADQRGDYLHFEMRIQNGRGPLESMDPTTEIGESTPASTPPGCGCGSGGGLVGSNNQQKAFNYFVANGYTPEQSAGIVGNMIHESGVEPARLQSTPPGTITHASAAAGSPAGWGIVQWTPAGKMINPSLARVPEAQVESLEYQLEFLHGQLEGDQPLPEGAAGAALKAARSVEAAAVAFGQKYERFAGSQDSSHPEFAERKATAAEVLATYGQGEGGGAGAGGCGAGNGDIVQTALMLAWDTPGHDSTAKEAAKPEYQEAMPRYNGSTGTVPYTDCGVFVATVMVMSGADPDYARRGTSVQMDYLRNSGKYEIFENLNDTSQLEPGDIFIIDGHTYLYTGNYQGGDGETYNAASASLGGHPPEASRVYFSDSRGHYTVARLKK